MPASCLPNKPEPINFDCPSCGAKYFVMMTGIVNRVQRRKFYCLKCNALFPGGEGEISLEYIPLDSDH